MTKVKVAHEELLTGEVADFFSHTRTKYGRSFAVVLGGHRLILDVVTRENTFGRRNDDEGCGTPPRPG